MQDVSLLPDYLHLLFSDVATQDMHTGAMALAANPRTRQGLWEYIQKNWDELRGGLGGNMVVFSRLLKVSLGKFNDRESDESIKKFFEGRDNRGYDRILAIVSDTILGKAVYKERDGEVVREWLSGNGYP